MSAVDGVEIAMVFAIMILGILLVISVMGK